MGLETADLLLSFDGNDLIAGGDGDDTLDGGAGNDILYGGSGLDIFRFSAAHGQDWIKDFNQSEDVIEYSGAKTDLLHGEKVLNNDGHDIIIFDNDFEENLLVVEIENTANSLKFNQLSL